LCSNRYIYAGDSQLGTKPTRLQDISARGRQMSNVFTSLKSY